MGFALSHSPGLDFQRTPVPAHAYKLPGLLPPVQRVTNPFEHAMAIWPGLADGNALGSKGAFTKPSRFGSEFPRSRTLYIRRLIADETKKAQDYEFVRDYLLSRENKPDEYLTVNTFRGARSNANLLSLTSFFVDLDLAIGNDEANRGQYTRYGNDFMRQLQDGLDVLSAEGIPTPNLITHTGKGTHLYWLFDRAVPARALSRWKVAMNILVEKLEAVGADKNARDPARVLRLVGSTNTSVLTDVGGELKPWKVTAQVLNPQRYDFDFLCDQILPLTREEYAEKKKARAAQIAEFIPHQIRRGKAGQAKSRPAAGRSYADTAAKRLADLETLAKKLFPHGVEEGSRDKYMLHATVNLAWICRAETLEKEVLRWKDRFVPTWTDRDALLSMKTAMAKAYEAYSLPERLSVFEDPRYVYSSKAVWAAFKDDIQRAGVLHQLGGIQPEGALKALARARRRALRDDHYTGLGVREANVGKAIEAHDLAAAGATTREIAASLGVSHKTVAKWLQLDLAALKAPNAAPASSSYPQGHVRQALLPKRVLNRGVALRALEPLSLKGVADSSQTHPQPASMLSSSASNIQASSRSPKQRGKGIEPISDLLGAMPEVQKNKASTMGMKSIPIAPSPVEQQGSGATYKNRYSSALLAWARGLGVKQALDVLELPYRLDVAYVPRKDMASYRLHVTREDGGVHELVCTGAKYFDKSPVNPIKGAGAIDLAMDILGLKFHQAMQKVLESPLVPHQLKP